MGSAPLPMLDGEPPRLDWRPMIRSLAAGLREGQATARLAAAFHDALIATLVETVRRHGGSEVVLAGGWAVAQAATASVGVPLTRAQKVRAGIRPYRPERLPANDAAIAVGQVLTRNRETSDDTRATLGACRV